MISLHTENTIRSCNVVLMLAYCPRQWADIKTTLVQRSMLTGFTHSSKHETFIPIYVVLMLGQRCRQWTSIKPTLSECQVFAGIRHCTPHNVHNFHCQKRLLTQPLQTIVHF